MSTFLILGALAVVLGLFSAVSIASSSGYMRTGEFVACWCFTSIISGVVMVIFYGGTIAVLNRYNVRETVSTYVERIVEKPAAEASVEETVLPSKVAEEVRKFDFGASLDFGGSQVEVGNFGGEKE